LPGAAVRGQKGGVEHALRLIESLQPARGAAPAVAVALGVALIARWRRYPLPAGIAAGLGVMAGWWAVLGMLTASPRQLPERLPLLALMLLLAAVLLTALARRWPWTALPGTLLGAVAAGWWMAGAPQVPADLARAWPSLAGIGVATLAIALAARARWSAPLAAAALLGGLLAVPSPGPAAVLAAALLAATVGGGAATAAAPPPAMLPVAGGIAALAALPVVARGGLADWAVAAAPLLAVAAGFLAGPRAGLPVGALVAAASIFFASMLR
jgi:hypothetical protein